MVELELLQLGGHEHLVRAASGGIPARDSLGVEPIELLVVVERVVVEEQGAAWMRAGPISHSPAGEALCLCKPSEGEHVGARRECPQPM
ncbi:MAG TPA: hypothetical protein VGJ58_14445 [Gaiellaceae bacterium]